MRDAEGWITALHLKRHPEGGWFREVYRAGETIPRRCLPHRFTGDRAHATAIYFLLDGTDLSAFHRLKQDELWHFYAGSPLVIHMIDPTGAYSPATVGTDIHAGESPLVVIRAGCLFGAEVADAASYSLVGCTVSPGFDFDDFDMPTRTQLLAQFPQHESIIHRLTR